MKKHDQAAVAWRAWQLLTDLERLLWDGYRKEFLEFTVKEAQQKNQQPLPSDQPPHK